MEINGATVEGREWDEEYEGLVLFRLNSALEEMGLSLGRVREILDTVPGVCFGGVLAGSFFGYRVRWSGDLRIDFSPGSENGFGRLCELLCEALEPSGYSFYWGGGVNWLV